MAERLTLVADRFVYEDWCDLKDTLGKDWDVILPLSSGAPKVLIAYDAVEGSYGTQIDKLEVETELYRFAVKRGAVELDWAGSFMIEWNTLRGTYAQQVRELMIEVCGFHEEDFVRNPDKEVVGL